jgi:hypothetical protein
MINIRADKNKKEITFICTEQKEYDLLIKGFMGYHLPIEEK